MAQVPFVATRTSTPTVCDPTVARAVEPSSITGTSDCAVVYGGMDAIGPTVICWPSTTIRAYLSRLLSPEHAGDADQRIRAVAGAIVTLTVTDADGSARQAPSVAKSTRAGLITMIGAGRAGPGGPCNPVWFQFSGF